MLNGEVCAYVSVYVRNLPSDGKFVTSVYKEPTFSRVFNK